VAEIIEWSPNKLGYAHAICLDCRGESFYIKTTDDNDFYSIICTGCGGEIFCDLQPVFKLY
jgi:hypothetical protein